MQPSIGRLAAALLLAAFSLFIAHPHAARAQDQLQVSGQVMDAEAESPLPGVNVVVMGTTRGTTTDAEGMYELAVPSPQDTLSFSFVGYETQEIPVEGRNTIDVDLSPQAIQSEELVVLGYGAAVEEKSVTGSVSSVNSADLAQGNPSTISDALAGKVAGVNFRKPNGRPGSGTQIQIRNLGNPLFVIDGVPKDEGQFNNLDYNDIENISILKDAAAASIYGMRASNGVVLVTTKSGSRGQDVQVNVDTYYALQQMTRFMQPADAATFYEARAQSDVNLTGSTDRTQEVLQNYRQEVPGYESTDWFDFATSESPAPQAYFNVGASGGTENINFYASVARLSENSIFRGFNEQGAPFSRTNLQLNVDAQPFEKLSVGARLNGRIESRHNPGLPGGDDYFAPLLGIMSQHPIYTPYANGNPNYPRTTNSINQSHAVNTYETSGYFTDEWRVAQPQIEAELEILDGLSLSGTYAYYFADQTNNTFEYTYDTYDYNAEADEYIVTGGNANPYREQIDRKIEEHNVQAQLSFNQTFGLHNLTGDLVAERNERSDHFWRNKSTPPTNEISLINFDDLDALGDDETTEARVGFALRTNYNYDDRYLLTVAGRYDGAYKFAPGQRWGLFPSISGGWIVSNESFYEGLGLSDVLTNFKLRLSYGQTGDDDFNGPAGGDGLGAFRYLGGYNFNTGAASVFDNQPMVGIGPRDRPQTAVSWLTSTMANVGVDFGLWNDRLSGTFDAFYRQRDGLLAARYDVLVPTEVDVTVGEENLNADETLGIEGSMTYASTIGEMNYTLSANATLARSRTAETYKPRFAHSWDEYRNSSEGRWNNVNWGYEVAGQFESQEQIDNYDVDVDGQNNSTLLPGDFIYEDQNEDGVIDGFDARPIGYGQPFGELDSPILSMGFNGSAQYKGADLRFTFTGASGQTYQRNFEARFPFQNNNNIPAYMFEDSYRRANPFDTENREWIEGSHPPIRQNTAGLTSWADSDFWTVNVTYLRLSNLELGYELPGNWLNWAGAQGLRVYGRTTNLFSLDNLKKYGLDPESAGTGNSGNGIGYAPMQEFTLGANLTF